MKSFDYDLFTIGAGSGGVRASRLAGSYGARVGIAEAFRVGGTCVIRGCIPKKLFVYASEFGKGFEDAKGYGWAHSDAAFDWPTLIANKDAEIDRLNSVYIRNLNAAGVEIFNSRAVITGPNQVYLVSEDREVTSARILVATGGQPWTDESIEGHDLAITSNEAFYLPTIPRSLVIAGGGYIAIEFAFIFRGLGAEVTLVYRGGDLLRTFDHDIGRAVRQEMERAGINVLTHRTFTRIAALPDNRKRVHLSDGQQLDTDLVFWAVGRRPATRALGLETAGVQLGKDGAVIVDEWGRTSTPSIFAIGDVTDRVSLTPVAIREGAAFAETEFNQNPQKVDYTNIPKAVFSQPPVASVGYTSEEARCDFGKVDIYKTDFRPMKNMLSGNQSRTLMKLVVDAASDRILGVHIFGESAPEMVQCLAIAVKAGLTKRQFDATMALHPTSAEELVLMRTKVVDA